MTQNLVETNDAFIPQLKQWAFPRRYHKKLRHYLDSGLMIICLVSYKCDGMEFRDICTAAFEPSDNKDFECYRFASRGIEYIRFNEANTKYEFYPNSFEEMMQLHDVEFIDFD